MAKLTLAALKAAWDEENRETGWRATGWWAASEWSRYSYAERFGYSDKFAKIYAVQKLRTDLLRYRNGVGGF